MTVRWGLVGAVILICSFVVGCSSVPLKRPQSLPDYAMSVTTADGWDLSLFRRRPAGKEVHGTPVLLVPSVGMNRMSFTAEGSDLAGYLSVHGFDVWLLDVRGSVSSRSPDHVTWAKSAWTFSDLLNHDVPAAVEAIVGETGRDGVAWVGHGLGAHLGAKYAAANPGRVTALVGLGLAGNCAYPTQAQKRMSAGGGLAAGGRGVPLRALGRAVSTTLHLAPDTPLLHSFFNESNVSTEAVANFAGEGLEDIPRSLLNELEVWCAGEEAPTDFFSGDFSTAAAPALFLSGRVDPLAPAWAVQAAWETWGATEKEAVILGEGWGQAHDYGHLALVLGDGVRDEVFPLILDWLVAERASGGGAEEDVPSYPAGGASEAAPVP